MDTAALAAAVRELAPPAARITVASGATWVRVTLVDAGDVAPSRLEHVITRMLFAGLTAGAGAPPTRFMWCAVRRPDRLIGEASWH